MYDMTAFQTRYFDIKLRNGKILNLEPPKLKVLKKMISLSDIGQTNQITKEEVNDLVVAISMALSKNKQNYKVSEEVVEEYFNVDEMIDFMGNYFEWVSEIQNQKN